MPWRAFSSAVVVLLVLGTVFSSPVTSHAASDNIPALAGTPYDLVNAVNALRASFGLAPYGISPILMSTAQAQADFMASTGDMTHAGPGGIGLTERLLAAGYPLAGDLSLGGFRAENITGGDESMPVEAAVDRWTGDALHLDTMVSQNLTEIGAGVALSGGRVYYVIDAALPATTGQPQIPGGLSAEPRTALPEIALVVIPVTVSTPNAAGQLVHEVRPGQTLWQIAIAYGVKIDEIKGLNSLLDNNIYPGNRLLIKTGVVISTGSPTAAMTEAIPSTAAPSLTAAPPIRSTAKTRSPDAPALASNSAVIGVAVGILALVILGGGIFTWLGRSKKR
jgi:LysM repeat protein